jgi:hypothetical protein
MKPKKVKKVQERKDDRLLAKKQKWATGMAKAKQKGVPPPYAIDAASGKLRKPVDADLAPKVLAKKQAAQDAKRLRKAAYDSKSPAEKAAHNTASATRQAASRQAHIDGNTKQNNRAKRVATKAAARQKGKAENNRHTTAARNAYTSAQGLPGRKETYASPQGSEYLIFVWIHVLNCATAEPYTGKDVRQAVFSSEVAQAKGRVGYNMFTGKQAKLVDSLPKPFENRPNSDGTTPLPGAAPQPGNPLNEFPIMHNARQGYDGRKPNPSDARIITQKNAAGQTELKGKIGHPAGTDDHVAF